MIRSPIVTVMEQAARKAGRTLLRDFGEVENLQVSLKGPANFVSAADRRAEEILHAELSKARKDFSFLMEERGEVPGKDASNVWVVDPLDGTTNFLHGIPLFAISIAHVKDGEPQAGLVFNPVTDELFVAERGKGAVQEAVGAAKSATVVSLPGSTVTVPSARGLVQDVAPARTIATLIVPVACSVRYFDTVPYARPGAAASVVASSLAPVVASVVASESASTRVASLDASGSAPPPRKIGPSNAPVSAA